MLEYLKNLNRGEWIFWFVVLVLGFFLVRFFVNWYRLSRQREEARKPELVHIEAKYWPLEQRQSKFLMLCRRGVPTGAVTMRDRKPMLLLANDEYLSWDDVPPEKRSSIEAATEVWEFQAEDPHSRMGASNRISWLDHQIQRLNHYEGSQVRKRELTDELKRTLFFIGETYGADLGRDVAKAALRSDRKQIVDAVFDMAAVAVSKRKARAETAPKSSSGLEVDFGPLKDSRPRLR